MPWAAVHLAVDESQTHDEHSNEVMQSHPPARGVAVVHEGPEGQLANTPAMLPHGDGIHDALPSSAAAAVSPSHVSVEARRTCSKALRQPSGPAIHEPRPVWNSTRTTEVAAGQVV